MKYLLVLLLLTACSVAPDQQNKISIIPEPVKIEPMSGSFTLSGNAAIGYNNAGAQHVAEMLAGKLNMPTGFQLTAKETAGAAIQLNLNQKADETIGSEGYTLNSSSKGVVINANQPAGLYYGMQTLMQLLPKEIESPSVQHVTWTIPAVNITDYPRFGWRGLMLDVSRHFFTKQEVEKYIDEMSAFKYNVFHWHLTDDEGWRVEIKSLPELTKTGACRVPRQGSYGNFPAPKPGEPATDCGYYTQDDIREIVQYAKDRYVTILPEIDVPGHSMAAVASYPYLCCTKDTSVRVNPGSNFAKWFDDGTFKMFDDNTLNPSDEKVYDFLDKVFTELAALFPGEYIHVGGDECYKGYWEKNRECQALMKKLNTNEVEKLQGYFMGRVEKILNAKGKKMIGWDEILEGGISPGASVMSWRGTEGGIKAAKMQHDVVMSPTTFAYLDYTQGDPTIDHPIYARLRMQKCYSYEPLPEGVDPKYILGGQGNLWTEQLPTFRSVEYMTYPRALALAEDFWTPAKEKNWNDFTGRVENQFGRWDAADVNYSKAMYDPIVKSSLNGDQLKLEISTEDPGLRVYYSIDNTMPDNHSPEFTGPVVMPINDFNLRVIAYKNGKPVSHLIVLDKDQLKARSDWE
jgi:hexosaminidase